MVSSSGDRWRCRRPPLRSPLRDVHSLPNEEKGRGKLCTRRTQEVAIAPRIFSAIKSGILCMKIKQKHTALVEIKQKFAENYVKILIDQALF